jgi:O-antigen biosynthesis protein
LSARAVVLLHDTNVREREFGVFRLWQELQSRWPSFEFPHGHGLGILGVGDELPRQLQRLFQTKGYARLTTAIRSVYASLGAGIRLRLEKDLQATGFQSHLSGQEQRISGLEQELAGSAQRISDLERELVRHRSEVERLTSACRAGEDRIGQLERALTQGEDRIAQLERALTQGGDNISHLEREIESLKSSRSWRLTAPLRWVDNSMRNGIWKKRVF